MNFLAHVYLAEDTPESIVGNMLGDFVDANFRRKYRPEIVRGIIMHQQIDMYTDSHPVFFRSMGRIDDKYRRLKGIMIDLFYDHFLAKHWGQYAEEPLEDFCERVYTIFEQHVSLLSPRLRRILPYMINDNWLLSYRHPEGIGWALSGISRRISRENHLGESIEQLHLHYDGFESDFQEFFPQLVAFTESLKNGGLNDILAG